MKIGAAVEQRWGLKENLQSSNKKNRKEDGDEEERSENGPGESQKEVKKGTPLLASC